MDLSLDPRDQILSTMQRIYRHGMTTTSGGNISIREANGDIWITPARLDKGALSRDEIVRVRPDGSVEGGAPSSELPFHESIYRARPDAHGIVHAHPVGLVAFSLIHESPDTRITCRAWQVCGRGAFAPYGLPGSAALGHSVAKRFTEGADCVIMENHGVVTAGRDLREAFLRFETFEFTARTHIQARLLGREPRLLPDAELALASRGIPYAEFEHGEPAGPERELRQVVCEFVRRAYRQRLFTGAQGAFSARLEGSSFLITPAEADRGALEVSDLVLIREGRAQAGAKPSRAAAAHEAIYRARPEVNAIVNACPVNSGAFSVTGTELDTTAMTECYVVVRQPARASYRMLFEDTAELAGLTSTERPVVLLENEGVLVTGRSPLEAFDRLEVVESTATSIIGSRAIGRLKPMSERTIRELEEVFLSGK